MNLFESFHFLRPGYLILILPLLGGMYWRVQRVSKHTAWLNALPKHLRKALIKKPSQWRNQLPLIGAFGLALLAIFVSAGPTWYRMASPFSEDIAPLVVVLDVSKSMQQQDIAPSRLYMAKQKVRTLVEQHNKGKVGLVVFSGSAHIAMPLSQDKSVLYSILEEIEPSVMPREGKFSHYSLPLVEQLMQEQTHGTVLLVTDGITEQSSRHWRAYFSAYEDQLVVYGVGKKNHTLGTPLQESKLRHLAASVGGEYHSIRIDNEDIEEIIADISSYAKLQSDSTLPWYDAGYWLLWPMIPLLLLWFRRGWHVQWTMCLVILSSMTFPNQSLAANWLDPWLTADQQGQYYLNKGLHEQAAESFDSSEHKAYAYYLSGDYQKAQAYYLQLDSLSSRLGAAAALAHQREYVAARQLYQEIVAEYPQSSDAQHNLQLMNSIIQQINDFSQSQAENGERQSSREIGEEPQTSDGVEQVVEQDQLIEQQFDAQMLLADQTLQDKWMKRVQSDLSQFMQLKFRQQLELGVATNEWHAND
tara:strand:+ start:1983 stop:3572 length:1590 start_codon:yes stop_codon:yes gene_type:complete